MTRPAIDSGTAFTLIVLLAAAVALPSHLGAQPPSLPFVLELRGELVSVRYTPGALDRAARVQERFHLLASELGNWTGRPVPLTVYLLSADEWSQAGIEEPWGLPGRMAGSTLALPAWGTPEAVEVWHRLLKGSLPELGVTALRDAPEEGASLAAADLTAQAPVVRALLDRMGFRGDRRWVNGLVAQAVVVSTLLRHDPRSLPEIDFFYRQLSEAGGGPGTLPVEVPTGDLSLEQRLWFEARYFEGARLLAEEAGKSLAKGILKRAKQSGGTITAAALLERFPALDGWLRSGFAPPAGR